MRRKGLMKRSLALFLAATLTVGSTVTVFAVEGTTEEITVTEETPDSENESSEENVTIEDSSSEENSGTQSEAEGENSEEIETEQFAETVFMALVASPEESNSEETLKSAFENAKTSFEEALKSDELTDAVKQLLEDTKTYCGNVEDSDANKTTASNISSLANKLQTSQKTGFYAQKTESGEYATSNGREFDQKDGEVKSQNTKYFSGNLGVETIEIPYSMYRDYVEYVYKNNKNAAEKDGIGIAMNESNHSEEMLYWELSDDGKKLTGKSYSLDELKAENPESNKQYFLGYVFKYEGGDSNYKYHIDGFIYTYEHVVNPPTEPSEEPETPEVPEETPDEDPEVIPEDDEVITIEDITPIQSDPVVNPEPVVEETPEVVAPVEEAPVVVPEAVAVVEETPVVPDNAVLGARRADEGSVLGAKRGLDRAVLGKRRSPKTNDSFALYIWMMFLAIFTGSAIVCTKSLNKMDKDI